MKRWKPHHCVQTNQINAIYRRGFHHRVILSRAVLSKQISIGGIWASTEWLGEERNAIRGIDYDIQTLHLGSSPSLDVGYFFKDENLALEFKMIWG